MKYKTSSSLSKDDLNEPMLTDLRGELDVKSSLTFKADSSISK